MSKRLLSILLLLCLTAPFLGSVLWVKHQKHLVKKKVKKEIISGLDKSELIQLSFSAVQIESELKWKHAKEFEFRNKMYDIVEQAISGDSTTFWCWLDKEETTLNNRLDKLLALVWKKNEQQQSQDQHLSAFVKSLCFPPPFSFKIELGVSFFALIEPSYLSAHNSIHQGVESPPPKV